MLNTRRKFLGFLAAAGALFSIRPIRSSAQTRPQQTRPQPPESAAGPDENSQPLPNSKSATKQMLEANDKDIKKNIERLYELVTDLKSQVEKTDSSKVLSLTLVKEADEIERLAHEIKNRAKG
ncbi:MAG TPA: twin-arginine translocation signal domain-containing protein [Candidatus Acidoferrum sp.]|nr:twin-arginine translocation signal domain-containing protein [Candidatus Acidoferrum sp.]